MKIFLSFSFNHGHELTKAVERLLASHSDVKPITGRSLGGQAVDAAVEAKILEAEALISLFTKKPIVGLGESPFSQAVQQEYYFARNRNLQTIAVVEKGLVFQDMSNKERIDFDPANPLEAVLRLTGTIAEWRRTLGQELKVQILPPTLAERLESDDKLTCSHRLWQEDLPTPWKEVKTISEDEVGTFVYVRGVREGHRIQLRVTGPQVNWQSSARLPWTMVQLKERQNG